MKYFFINSKKEAVSILNRERKLSDDEVGEMFDDIFTKNSRGAVTYYGDLKEYASQVTGCKHVLMLFDEDDEVTAAGMRMFKNGYLVPYCYIKPKTKVDEAGARTLKGIRNEIGSIFTFWKYMSLEERSIYKGTDAFMAMILDELFISKPEDIEEGSPIEYLHDLLNIVGGKEEPLTLEEFLAVAPERLEHNMDRTRLTNFYALINRSFYGLHMIYILFRDEDYNSMLAVNPALFGIDDEETADTYRRLALVVYIIPAFYSRFELSRILNAPESLFKGLTGLTNEI